MAVIASTMKTFVDITDTKSLGSTLGSNLGTIQLKDVNVLPNTFDPNWTTTPLKLTPALYLDADVLALTAAGVTLTWKRKVGGNAETALVSGETVADGILTVNKNVLNDVSAPITYICYITYYDAETKITTNKVEQMTFTLLKEAENAKLCSISGEQTFKYDKSSTLVGATQITLNALVQNVNISTWQYKKSDGTWAAYPTTSDNANVTGATLIVKPAHSVFFDNVATIKLVTDDPNVYDIISIQKIYDGATGTPGVAGTGGLSVIVGNEAQTIACTSGGLVASATDVTIPFSGYVGITQVATTVAVGTLPSGVTVKSNTAATASAAGSLVLTFAANATLGNAADLNGTIDLTFTLNGKTVVKKFGWSKSNKGATGATGAPGADSVILTVLTPNGNIIANGTGSLTLEANGYKGATVITSGATYQWAKLVNGTWTNVSGGTAKTLTINASDIVNVESYRCTMTYASKTYVGYASVYDKTDPYVCEMLSTNGFEFKNGNVATAAYIILRRGTEEVDSLLGPISETAPSSPKSGDYYYRIDKTAKTVTLMKYDGTSWATSTDKQEYEYNWYLANGTSDNGTIKKTGKVVFMSTADINKLASYKVEVDDGL